MRLRPGGPAIVARKENRIESRVGRVQIAGNEDPSQYRFSPGQLQEDGTGLLFRAREASLLHIFLGAREWNAHGSAGILESKKPAKHEAEHSFHGIQKVTMQRCPWARNELAARYHDEEWGVPVHDDRLLFEFLILEGAQAGLSWDTILKKRDHYRLVFDGFDPVKVAGYDASKVEQLLSDPGIVRNRLKIASAVTNAKAFLETAQEFDSFDAYIWRFVGGSPKVNAWTSLERLPAKTPESYAMSKDLQRRGFKFVGSTICYAFMQAVGMVNDHTLDCFRRVGGHA